MNPGYILHECKQGSPDWLNARAGVITASEFNKARARMKVARDGKQKGDFTDAALDYAFQKAIERISRVPLDENHVTWQMKRGHELEPAARICHEDLLARRGGDLSNTMVLEAGFMTTPDGIFGCSVDGLIGEHGGSEYKCLTAAAKLRKVILNDDISDYMDQIQGCMAISGRSWWHFGLYCPALKPVHMEFQMMEVERDDDYIDELWRDLLAFKVVVDGYEQALRLRGAEYIAAAVEEARAKLAEPAAEVEPIEE
jgi:hypothetical protein